MTTTSAIIHIGGALAPSLRGNLAQLIARSRVAAGWSEPRLNEAEAAQMIALAIAVGTSLDLYDEESKTGQFQELEAWLRTHGLCYQRRCEGAGELDPAMAMYDGRQLLEYMADAEGAVYVSLKQLAEHQAAGTVNTLLEEMKAMEAPVPPLSCGGAGGNHKPSREHQ